MANPRFKREYMLEWPRSSIYDGGIEEATPSHRFMVGEHEWHEIEPGQWILPNPLTPHDDPPIGEVTDHGAKGDRRRITWKAGKWSSAAPSVEEAMRQATFHVKNADRLRGREGIDKAQLRATAEALEWVDDPDPDP